MAVSKTESFEALKRRGKPSKAVRRSREKLRHQAAMVHRHALPRKNPPSHPEHQTSRTISDVEAWTQAVLAGERNSALFDPDRDAVLEELRRELLPGEQFPIGQMASLWAENSWRTTLTRWSKMAIGRENFNIMTFSHMLSLRTDRFWLGCMESVLNTLDALPHSLGMRIRMEDWNALAREMPALTIEEQASFFFPRQVIGHGPGVLQRRAGFLSQFDDEEYTGFLEHVQTHALLQFPDLQWLLRTTPAEAVTMARVLEHVVDWFDNPSSATKQQKRVGNAQIRDGLHRVLQRIHDPRELSISQLEDEIQRHSQEIESSVMSSVRDNMSFFQSQYGQETLQKRPEDDWTEYRLRFAEPAWVVVLLQVKDLFLKGYPCSWQEKLGKTGTSAIVKVETTRKLRKLISDAMSSVEEIIAQWDARTNDDENGPSEEVWKNAQARSVLNEWVLEPSDDQKRNSAQASVWVRGTHQNIGVEPSREAGSAPALHAEELEDQKTQSVQPRTAHQKREPQSQRNGTHRQQINGAVQLPAGQRSCQQNGAPPFCHPLPHSQDTAEQQGRGQPQPVERAQPFPQEFEQTPEQAAYSRQQEALRRFMVLHNRSLEHTQRLMASLH
ncbi:hypothetical protein LEL_10696 [Akanthomyces lecanii RCEF 1005]|uniref:Uncharacterized protein n=1 Tax=Akanthomyces lecanii RCEF 1005 TaxID=1081108 RepID=A0A167W1U1_CORDF|nr:hypothetical protein LEL_10696 [Akanthomyces lecanii RCEF 1005]